MAYPQATRDKLSHLHIPVTITDHHHDIPAVVAQVKQWATQNIRIKVSFGARKQKFFLKTSFENVVSPGVALSPVIPH